MNTYLFLAFCALVGIASGLCFNSKLEKKLRGTHSASDSTLDESEPFGLKVVVIQLLLLALIFFGPSVFLSITGDHFYLGQGLKKIIFFYYFGMLAGKGIRFLCWYSRRSDWSVTIEQNK